MPKKSKKEKEKEEFLRELAERIKSEKSENPDESLEEEIESGVDEEARDFGNIDFQQFTRFQIGETEGSPVLESVAREMPGPRFVRVGLAAPEAGRNASGGSSENGTTYLPTNANVNEPTYLSSSEQIYKTPETLNFSDVGRKGVDDLNTQNQEVFFRSSETSHEQQGFERISLRPERLDVQNQGRQNPLDAEKEKYQKYDLNKKSSY